jgi:hypothetical protein
LLDGEVEHASVLAHALGLGEQLKALTDMADEGDLLSGSRS